MPEGLAKNGRIVFNISPEAVCRLLIADKAVSFTARFSGRHKIFYLPWRTFWPFTKTTADGAFLSRKRGKSTRIGRHKI